MDATRLLTIQRLLHERYSERGPGAAVLLICDDLPVLMAGYGYADVHERIPITPLTLFDLASVAKHLTAYAVLLLASRGKLTPADEVRQYLPELDDYETGGRPLRLTDLLHHCSGLPEYVEEIEEVEYASFTNSRLLTWLPEQLYSFAPGSEGFSLKADDSTYCNTNYALLACVLERITGQPFPDYLKAEIFTPLRMKDTFCDPWIAQHPGQACRYDHNGYLLTHPRTIPVYGDGNVFSTLADFLRWDAELTNPTLMDRAWLDRAFVCGALDDGRVTDYACGWYVRTWTGRRVAWHGGNWDGTTACTSRWFEDCTRIVVFSNTQQTSASDVVAEIEGIALD